MILMENMKLLIRAKLQQQQTTTTACCRRSCKMWDFFFLIFASWGMPLHTNSDTPYNTEEKWGSQNGSKPLGKSKRYLFVELLLSSICRDVFSSLADWSCSYFSLYIYFFLCRCTLMQLLAPSLSTHSVKNSVLLLKACKTPSCCQLQVQCRDLASMDPS